jgi:hypothetical protein
VAILRKPGSIIPVFLPSEHALPAAERVVVWVRIPDKGIFLQCEQICGLDLGNFETSRRIVGLLTERLENIHHDDGTPFELERDASGYLTDECAAWLSPYLNELGTLCLNSGRLMPVDRKNCSSP